MPTLDWLNRAQAFTTAARVPYRLLEEVSVHTVTRAPTHAPPAQAELVEALPLDTSNAATQPTHGNPPRLCWCMAKPAVWGKSA